MTEARGDVAEQRAEWFGQQFGRLKSNVAHVIKGKPAAIHRACVCLMAEGHLLIDDVPGTGKTAMAKTLAASIAGSWHRIQFTPDLLPTDVTGVSIYNQRNGTFEFHPGAVFANVVLGDEINRASPKTQAALLEVMEERQVTVDSTTYETPRPFLVIATQNPVEYDGTYRLPEAQLDRFLMRISLGYPAMADELEVLTSRGAAATLPDIEPVMSAGDVRTMIQMTDEVHLNDSIGEYVLRLARATRDHPELRLGVSTRGALALCRAARAHAFSQSRPYVIPEDVQDLVSEVFAHRMFATPEAELSGRTTTDIVNEVVGATPTPSLQRS